MNALAMARLLQAHGIKDASKWQIIPEALYDRAKLAKTVIPGKVTLFQVGAGQSSKDDNDTNAPHSGQMPAGTRFLMSGFGLSFQFQGKPSVSKVGLLDDIHALGAGGRVEFSYKNQILVKKGPLGSVPAEFGENGAVAMTGAAEAALAVNSWRGNVTALSLLLKPGETFKMEVIPECAALTEDIFLYGFIYGLKLIERG